MHAAYRRRTQPAADLHRLLRRAVRALHQDPRLVGADRHQRQVDCPALLPHLLEHRPERRVADELDRAPGGLDAKAAPQAGVAVEEAALAEMDRRRAVRRDPGTSAGCYQSSSKTWPNRPCSRWRDSRSAVTSAGRIAQTIHSVGRSRWS